MNNILKQIVLEKCPHQLSFDIDDDDELNPPTKKWRDTEHFGEFLSTRSWQRLMVCLRIRGLHWTTNLLLSPTKG